MSLIPQSFIDDLLSRSDIVDLIDSRVKLKRNGKEYSACCPFHDEKTPSFTVSREKQFFYCFGCGASGNVIRFLMDYEHLSFPKAIETLATSVGVQIPRDHNPEHEAHEKIRSSLYQVMEFVHSYYQRQLKEHNQRAVAVNYLKRRGLSGEIISRFGIGFAPLGFDNLTQMSVPSDVSPSLLLEAGMLIENQQQGFHDRFRQRIMFPIRDTRGRVIAFGGRLLGGGKPKYLNSPETKLFHKQKTLYGLYEARQACRQLSRLLVVEGYMDVVSLAQFGIHYAVATLGTACTSAHLQLAFRFVSEVIFCFDGDEAGRRAARRAMENALPLMEDGRQIKFLYLPKGEDPDTLIRHIGTDKFSRLIDQSLPLESVLFDELSQHLDARTLEGRARLCKLAVPLLNQLPRGIYRALCFDQLAKRTQLSTETIMAVLDELPEGAIAGASTADAPAINSVGQGASQAKNKPGVTRFHQVPVKDSVPLSSARATLLNPENLAIALLLYQPTLVQHAVDLDELHYSDSPSVKVFLELVALLRQRPGFSSGQILGYWQGANGEEATLMLQRLLGHASLFHRAGELSIKDQSHSFDPSQEFINALEHVKNHLRQQGCDTIVQQLNQKPFHAWSSADKQLYREVTSQSLH